MRGLIMQYGYFDSKNKEYIITKPDTPARGPIILAHQSMVQLYQIMPEVTALRSLELTAGY